MFSGVLNLMTFLRVGVVFVIALLAGVIWLQNAKLESRDKKIATLEANISACQSKVEAKSFESEWSQKFGDALAEQTWSEADSAIEDKGDKDEKSNINSSSSVFYDSF